MVDVAAAGGVDADLACAGRDDLSHLRLAGDGEAVAQERVVQPAAVEVVDVHPRVVDCDRATVELELGGKRLRQPLAALRQYQPPRFAPAPARVAKIRDRVARRAFRPRLVLVGKRAEEALALLAAFLDEALLHGARHLEIVHGAGEGILRRVVREFLAERGEVAGFGAAGVAEGGDNVTVVELR